MVECPEEGIPPYGPGGLCRAGLADGVFGFGGADGGDGGEAALDLGLGDARVKLHTVFLLSGWSADGSEDAPTPGPSPYRGRGEQALSVSPLPR